MKVRYRLTYRGECGRQFYCIDSETGKRVQLAHQGSRCGRTNHARQKSIAPRTRAYLQIARAYLSGTDSGVATRTWQNALTAIVESKYGSTQQRWITAAKDKALDGLWHKTIIETQAESLFEALKAGTVSTNAHLRKLHNFCVSMNWPSHGRRFMK